MVWLHLQGFADALQVEVRQSFIFSTSASKRFGACGCMACYNTYRLHSVPFYRIDILCSLSTVHVNRH